MVRRNLGDGIIPSRITHVHNRELELIPPSLEWMDGTNHLLTQWLILACWESKGFVAKPWASIPTSRIWTPRVIEQVPGVGKNGCVGQLRGLQRRVSNSNVMYQPCTNPTSPTGAVWMFNAEWEFSISIWVHVERAEKNTVVPMRVNQRKSHSKQWYEPWW